LHFSTTLDPLTRFSIESSFRSAADSAARKMAGAAAYASEQAADRMSEKMDETRREIRNDISDFRTEMLDQAGELGKTIKAVGTDLGNGFCRIEKSMAINNDRLLQLYGGVDLVRRNLVEGFEAVIDKLEEIQDTLGRIERGVMNPEETRALERYRRARAFLAKGRATDALETINAAMNNDGGPSLAHMPELRCLRGAIRLGLYDSSTTSHLDLAGAEDDFAEALDFAKDEAKPSIREHLALAHWGRQNYPAAYAIYEGNKANADAQFHAGRCMIQMGRHDHAQDHFRAALERDPRYFAIAAADPVLQGHPDLLKSVAQKIEVDRRDAARRKERDLQKQSEKLRSSLGKVLDLSPIKDLQLAMETWIEGCKVFRSIKLSERKIAQELAKVHGIPDLEITIYIAADPFDKRAEEAFKAGEDIIKLVNDHVGLKDLIEGIATNGEVPPSYEFTGILQRIERAYERIQEQITLMQNLAYADGALSEELTPSVWSNAHPGDWRSYMAPRPKGWLAGKRYDRNYDKHRDEANAKYFAKQDRERQIKAEATQRVQEIMQDELVPKAQPHFDSLVAQADRVQRALDLIKIKRKALYRLEGVFS